MNNPSSTAVAEFAGSIEEVAMQHWDDFSLANKPSTSPVPLEKVVLEIRTCFFAEGHSLAKCWGFVSFRRVVTSV